MRPLARATTCANCDTVEDQQVESREHCKRGAGMARLLVLVSLVSLFQPAATLALHPAGQRHSRLTPQYFPFPSDLTSKQTQTIANCPETFATGALAFGANVLRLPSFARNSPRAAYSPALRASSDGESQRLKTAGSSIVRRRRQGRVIGRFLYQKLQYVDMSKEHAL